MSVLVAIVILGVVIVALTGVIVYLVKRRMDRWAEAMIASIDLDEFAEYCSCKPCRDTGRAMHQAAPHVPRVHVHAYTPLNVTQAEAAEQSPAGAAPIV